MFQVTLTWDEVWECCQYGCKRRFSAMRKKRGEGHSGEPPYDRWGLDIEACGAEKAFSKWSGIQWVPFSENPSELPGDVGIYQIRSTTLKHGGLLVHKPEQGDSSDAPFVLVTGHHPDFTIQGWAWGREAQQEKYWRTDIPRDAFIVPQDELRCMTTLLNETA